MEGNKIAFWSNRFCRIIFVGCLTVFVLGGAAAAQGDEGFESTDPVLISEETSTKAIAVQPENWTGRLPKVTTEIFPPGSRAMVFVTNIGLMRGEGANAFRVFAEDANGKRYRLMAEDIQGRGKQDPVYGLTLRIVDAAGYNGQPAQTGGGSDLDFLAWKYQQSRSIAVR